MLADAADFARAKVPLALLLRPMAKRRDAEAPLDLVDFGSSGPPRCGQCKAYVSAFARWEQGRKRVIQCRFNVGVLEAFPKRKASTL